MTPKEKATILVSRFMFMKTITNSTMFSKNSALICVEEILEYLGEEGYPPEYMYWEEVRKEIEKL